MSIDVNVQNDLVIVTESSEDITVNVSNAAGPAGVGVPVGGTTGQVLKKLSNTNYDTYWALDGGGVPYSGATGQVDLGNYDLKVQGLTIGKGNNSLVNNTALGHSTLLTATTGNFNTAVGYESLRNTTTGQYNTAVGQSSLFSNNTGGQNTALGLNALLSNTSGSSNVAVGLDTLQHITTGSSNTAIGYNAGSHITGGSTPNTTATNSVFIGRDSKANADGQTNQIVIGQNAVGNGSNTATFGNTATTANYFTGSINGGSFVKSGGTSSQFLKADGSVDSTTYVGGSGTSGQVAYWNGTSSQTGSNNLFWDAANSRLGIGTNSPVSSLDVNGISVLRGSSSYFGIYGTNGTGGTDHYIRIPDLDIATFNPGISFYSNGVRRITLYRGGNDQLFTRISGTDRMALFGTGNLVLQNGGTFTDGGQRLQVMGGAMVNGMFEVGTYIKSVTNIPVSIQAHVGAGNILTLQYFTGNGTQTANTHNVIASGISFVPTSGNAIFNQIQFSPTINQTGGANGITRGLYIAPTLSAAADWRSIEWSNNSGWGLYGAGTAPNFLGGNLTVSRNQNAVTLLTISNSTNNTDAAAAINIVPNAGNYQLGKNSSGTTVYKILSANDAYLYNGFIGDLSFLNDHSTGKIKFASGASSTAQMTLTAAGRLLLGLTSESTFLLDVNGTARVSGLSTFNDAVLVKKDQNAETTLTIENATTGTASGSKIRFVVSGGVGEGSVSKFTSSFTPFKIIGASDFALFNTTNGDISILNNFTSGTIKMAAGGSSNTQLQIKTNGSVRYIPMAEPVSGAQSGDVYYDSSTNKLRCYNGTSWNDLF